MTLDAYMFMDPEKVAIRRQEEALRKTRACGYCIHHKTLETTDETLHACDAGRHYGKRCDRYQTTTKGKKP